MEVFSFFMYNLYIQSLSVLTKEEHETFQSFINNPEIQKKIKFFIQEYNPKIVGFLIDENWGVVAFMFSENRKVGLIIDLLSPSIDIDEINSNLLMKEILKAYEEGLNSLADN